VSVVASGAFDSNLNRDEDNLHTYGAVGGARAKYRTRTARHTFDLEYETALHSYTASNRWDRLSHRARGLVEREVASRWAVGVVGQAALKGSSEDRSIGNEFILEPRVEYDLDDESRLRLYGALRVRDYPDDPTQNALNRYAGVEFTQELDDDREWEVGLRREVNDADSTRRYYRRWTWHTQYATPVGGGGVLELELKIRSRRFPQRLVELDDEDFPREDHRWTPSAQWARPLNGLWSLIVEYEYETRASNDPEQAYQGHQARVSFVRRVW